MKQFCGASNLNIDKAVHLLQQYECTDNSDESEFEAGSGIVQQMEGFTLEEARVIEEFIGEVDVFGFSGSDPILTSSVVEPDERAGKVPCDVCGEWFKPRGLKIHQTKRH